MGRINQDLYGEPQIVSVVKAQRLTWMGHAMRIEDNRMARKMQENSIDKHKVESQDQDGETK